MPAMKHGVFLPPFGELSDPHWLIDLAVMAEESGWDGLFLWDHVLRREGQPQQVADPFVALAAIACNTSRLRLGTMVTPLVRRRLQVLARQVVTLDHLSGGRVTLGLGLGVDTSGELSRFGELLDPAARGDLLDEGAGLLASMLAGQLVEHRGEHFVADGVRLLPPSLQSPRLPMWFGARGERPTGRAVKRAARFEGIFLIDAGLPELEAAVATLVTERGSLAGFDIAVLSVEEMALDEAAALGATWAMLPVRPESPAADVSRLVELGPPITPPRRRLRTFADWSCAWIGRRRRGGWSQAPVGESRCPAATSNDTSKGPSSSVMRSASALGTAFRDSSSFLCVAACARP